MDSQTINNKHITQDQITEWIKMVWPAAGAVEPAAVYRSNDWGVTTRFKITDETGKTVEVICKIGFLPIFETSVSIYRLLNKVSPDRVPNLLYGEFKDGKAWMLFQPFEGQNISDSDKQQSLQNIALAMAEIQLQISALLEQEQAQIPTISISSIPSLFDELINSYFNQWQHDSAIVASQLEISLDKYMEIFSRESLADMKNSLSEMAVELEHMNIPYSIDHLDLHSGNAMRQEDGKIVIYDWEEAVISCPFFSTDKLLDEARSLDADAAEDTLWSGSQIAVRDRYLSGFAKLTQSQKLHAFDMAMCLAPIKYAYQSTFFINQVGWQEHAPSLIAQSIAKAHQRIKAKKQAR